MKGNASRMVSLFGIVALGVMMLTGLMSIAPSMRSAAQKYYVQQNVFDLRVLSTLGLSDQDIAAIAATPGVEAVMPVKTLDLEANWQGQEERMVVQLQALQQDPAADTDANMNCLVLRSGRMPQAADECVVHVMGYQAEIAEGTVLTLPEDTEGTKHKEYTVVGLVQDPQHISTDKESSTVGNGQLNYIAYVLDGELTADYYTACYIKAENAGQYDNYSQEYQEAVDRVADRLEQISTAQCVQRREQLMDTANQKLAEARQTYDDQKAEALRQFAQAEQQLDDAQQKLDQAKAQLDVQREVVANLKKNIEVRSPISGVVTARNYESGDLFAQQPILHIMQIDPLKVIANISEQYFPNVKVGMPVKLAVDIFPDEEFTGTVSLIYPALDPTTRTFKVEVKVPNAKRTLRPGMYARTTFDMGSKEGVMVPDIR